MLYFIPTPIGNKEDITLRGLRLLKDLNVFFCEDTRRFKDLCRLYDIDYIDKKLYPLTSFTDNGKLHYYISILKDIDCAVVSEAGTPGLSDPGKSLVKLCRENNIPFDVLPGANALIPTIVGAYTDTSTFAYYGFLPPKKGRQTILKKILGEDKPVILYESVHRIQKLVDELQGLAYTGQIGIWREISKKFEQKVWGNIDTIATQLANGLIPIKGEFVVILAP